MGTAALVILVNPSRASPRWGATPKIMRHSGSGLSQKYLPFTLLFTRGNPQSGHRLGSSTFTDLSLTYLIEANKPSRIQFGKGQKTPITDIGVIPWKFLELGDLVDFIIPANGSPIHYEKMPLLGERWLAPAFNHREFQPYFSLAFYCRDGIVDLRLHAIGRSCRGLFRNRYISGRQQYPCYQRRFDSFLSLHVLV